MYLPNNAQRNRAVYYSGVLLLVYMAVFWIMLLFALMPRWFGWGSFFQSYTAVIVMNQLHTFFVPVEICLAILTPLWMARSVGNLGKMGLKTKYGAMAAGWGWFIPFANFVLPFMVLRHTINRYSDLMDKFRMAPVDHKLGRDFLLRRIGLYWGLWVFTFPFSFGFGAIFMGIIDQAEGLMMGMGTEHIMYLGMEVKMTLDIVAILLFLGIVKGIGRLEEEAQALVEAEILEKYWEEKQKQQQAPPAIPGAVPAWYVAPDPGTVT